MWDNGANMNFKRFASLFNSRTCLFSYPPPIRTGRYVRSPNSKIKPKDIDVGQGGESTVNLNPINLAVFLNHFPPFYVSGAGAQDIWKNGSDFSSEVGLGDASINKYRGVARESFPPFKSSARRN